MCETESKKRIKFLPLYSPYFYVQHTLLNHSIDGWNMNAAAKHLSYLYSKKNIAWPKSQSKKRIVQTCFRAKLCVKIFGWFEIEFCFYYFFFVFVLKLFVIRIWVWFSKCTLKQKKKSSTDIVMQRKHDKDQRNFCFDKPWIMRILWKIKDIFSFIFFGFCLAIGRTVYIFPF